MSEREILSHEGNSMAVETLLGTRFNADESLEPASIDPLNLGARIEELKLLKPGWLDGTGVPPAHGGLAWLNRAFDEYYPEELPRPYLFPTPEGHVLAEWSLRPRSITLQIDLSARSGDWHALNLATDAEETRELDLREPECWQWLARRIRTYGAEVA